MTESPWHNLFAYNLFLRPTKEEILNQVKAEWTIICAPGFHADPKIDGTRQSNFAVLNFTKKIILLVEQDILAKSKGIFPY